MRRSGQAFLAVAALLLTTASASAGAVVLTDLNVRAGPGTRFPVIGGLPRGASVQVLGCTPSWCNIGWSGSAFVSAAYLGFDGPAPYMNGPAVVPVGFPVAVPVAVPVPVPTPIVVTEPNPAFIVAPAAPIFYGPPPRLYINPPVPQPAAWGGGWGGGWGGCCW